MALDSRTSLSLGSNRRQNVAKITQRNNRSRFPIQWRKWQSFDGSGDQVDLQAAVATRNLGAATSWLLEGFTGLTIQLLVNGLSRGTIPSTPGAPLAGGAINQGDSVTIRKLATPDGSGIFTVKGLDASGKVIAFGKFEAN